jgi:cadmium resistance protein CadD (predicted permease)
VLVIVASAVGVFAATDIDDLIVLTVLFGSRRLSRWQIVAGQYTGIAALVAVSVLAAAGLRLLPDRWVGLLGVVPLALGVRGLLRGNHDDRDMVNGFAGVVGVTVANGADNVSVYTPLFREAGWGTVGYAIVFAVMVVIWLATAEFLASRAPVAAVLDRWGRWIVPIVYMTIGTLLITSTISK